MALLRRLCSILLLAVFCLPFLTPLFALGEDAESGLPACCRRSGQHHCSMMTMAAAQRDSRAPAVGVVTAKCPCCPGMISSTATPDIYQASAADTIFAGLLSHPSGVAQTESRRRIAEDRSRQKRGPPAPALAHA